MSVVLSAVLTALPVAQAQDTKNTAPAARYQFWSGTVGAISHDSISVRRELPGREPETRTFVLTATTKIDGDLQKSSRVTVGYEQFDELSIARRIIVRKPRRR